MGYIRDDLLGYGYTEVDEIYDPYANSAMVAAALDEGRGIVNYCGHGSTTSWGSSGFSNGDVNNLTNNGMLPFILSVACYNGTFTGGTCFAEAWLRATNAGEPSGAIACYMSYISQSWDPPMYAQDEATDLLVADAMRTVGGLWFNGSCEMMDQTGTAGANEFRNWTIFGDPSVCVRTKTATSLTAVHDGALLIGLDTYDVTVPGTPGALCALYGDGVLYGTAITDDLGHATIAMDAPPLAPMTVTLTVTAYNKATLIEDVQVLPPEGPYLVFDSVAVIDPEGDDDGELDNGEAAGLSLTVENLGVEDATGVTAMLATEDPYLTIAAGEVSFPDVLAGGTAVCLGPCPVTVAGNVPDGHVVELALSITADNGAWDGTFFVTVQAPVLAVQGVVVDDAAEGDGDGIVEPGELVDVMVQVTNVGHSASASGNGTLTSDDPFATIVAGSARNDAVPVGEIGEIGPFTVQVEPLCPEPAFLSLQLALTDLVGFAAELPLEFTVGGWYDDVELDRGWTIGAADDDATSGIWERVDPLGTTYEGHQVQPDDDHTAEPGSLCFVTGNGTQGGAAGENDVDGGKTTLLSPVFDLTGATSATVSYWRWYTNAWGNNPDQDWWDVEVTADGETWVSLEHTLESTEVWVFQTFELTDYIALTDQVQLRFVAADESSGSLVEAAVDDFLLRAERPTSTPVEDRGELPLRVALGKNYPNPFNPKTTIAFAMPQSGRAELAIFDVAGRRVATLVNENLVAGRHERTWSGRDTSGRQVASGVYFYRLVTDGTVLTKTMTLVK
jgi:hypothetical protein